MIGVDVGGTFTDLVMFDEEGNTIIEKVPSTPHDMSEGVLDGLTSLEATLNLDRRLLSSLTRFVHGTTIAANSFLERKGAHIGFITTKGLRDTLVMRRMFRENMYDTRAPEPTPLVSRIDIFEIDERMDKSGQVVRRLNEDEVWAIAVEIKRRKIESVGICFVFSFRNPSHELRVKEILRECLPDLHISLSYEVCPEIRDYERACTTHLNAYLQPPVDRYLKHLDKELRARDAAVPMQVMQSYGGVTSASESVRKPVNLLLSGPAGGVIGSAYWGKFTGHPNVISFDMGGTSADISLIVDGLPSLSTPITSTATHCKFEGWDVLIPFIEIHTIGSGGGSVAWIDESGALHVGPRSVGAVPGPACYGLGGDAASVTDADLLLGYINPAYYLGGRIPLSVEKAEAAVKRIASRLGYSPIEAAEGIFRIINANMINGIRVVSVEKGHDPRKFSMLSFGGAAAIHTTALINDLGIGRVIIPPGASTFSAFGLLCTDLRHDYVTTISKMICDLDPTDINRAADDMVRHGRTEFASSTGPQLRFECVGDMRYRGQAHDIRVPFPIPVRSTNEVINAFESTYKRAYGYLLAENNIQLVNLRVFAFMPTEKPKIVAEPETHLINPAAYKGTRGVYFVEDGGFVKTALFDGDLLRAGNEVEGPAVVELSTTTAVVRPGQVLRVDPYRNFVVQPGGGLI
jgi:N-methylhydantoinase A